jgi:hypothetical protein
MLPPLSPLSRGIAIAIVVAGLVLTSSTSHAATIPSKGGVVIFTSSDADNDKFAVANEFVSMESFGMTSTFKFPNGKTLQMQPPALRMVVPYPDYTALTLVTEADWQAMEKIAEDADKAAKKYPKSVPLMEALKATLNTALQKHQQGYVVIQGGWLSKADYEKKVGDTKADYVARLDIMGKTYKNVRLSTVADEQVKIMHDGGFSTVPLAELKKLPDSERKPLARTNPRLASILGYNAADLGSSAGSIAAAVVQNSGGLSTFSFSIVGDQVTITRVGGSTETFAMDKLPANYLSANPELAQAVKDYLAKKASK